MCSSDLEGKSVFSGIAIGKISILQKVDTSVKRVHVEDPEEEVKRVEAAKEQAVAQLQKLSGWNCVRNRQQLSEDDGISGSVRTGFCAERL